MASEVTRVMVNNSLLLTPMPLCDSINVDNPKTCPRFKLCVARDLRDEAKEAISGVLQSVTLQDLAECQRQKGYPPF